MIHLSKAAWHGTIGGYTNHGCRCDDCKEANSQTCWEWRKRKRAAGAGRPVGSKTKKWWLWCDACDHSCELAVDMHQHTLTDHQRQATANERTPRRER